MLEIKNFTPRAYQLSILETSKKSNTLACLPTGTGKTKIAIMLAIDRLNKFPDSKVLICSPTKPLTNQIAEEFKSSTTINPALVSVLTGALPPEERKKFWQISKVIAATPQTIENDLASNKISLDDVSMLCIDECHRSRQKFANTKIAKIYFQQSKCPRILALTASPGSTKEKINEICSNLNIESVEIKTEQDQDVIPYVQKKETEYITVELPPSLLEIHSLIKKVYQEKVSSLRKFGLHKPSNLINKKDLLQMQKYFQSQIKKRDMRAFWGSSLVAQCLKVSHLLELLETQSLNSPLDFFQKMSQESSKASRIITKEKNISLAIKKINDLKNQNIIHPKLEKLKEFIKSQIASNPESKIMIFANYRNTVEEIVNLLSSISQVKPIKLIGQKEGLSQKKQIETIQKFEQNIFNVLVATSIGEEGLSIGSLDICIFYDAVPSEIRSIQRSGRVARTKPGKIILLLTKTGRDQVYFWSAKRKENVMKKTLRQMQLQNEITLENQEEQKTQKTLI